jgi:hypothetical protein
MITVFTGRCKDGTWRQRPIYTAIGKEVEFDAALTPGESKRAYVEQGPIRRRGKRGGRNHRN